MKKEINILIKCEKDGMFFVYVMKDIHIEWYDLVASFGSMEGVIGYLKQNYSN